MVSFGRISLLSLGSRLWLFGLFDLWILVGLWPISCRGCAPSFSSFSPSLSSVGDRHLGVCSGGGLVWWWRGVRL